MSEIDTTQTDEPTNELANLDDAELASLESEAVAAFAELNKVSDDDLTTEQLEEMSALADSIQAIRGEQDVRAQEREATKAKRAQMAQDIGIKDDDEDEAEAKTEEVEEKELQPAASQPVVDFAAIKRNAPQVEVDTETEVVEPDMVITAAADIPGFTNGSLISDRKTLAKAMAARARGLNDKSPRVGVASISRKVDVKIEESDSGQQALEKIEEFINGKLKGGASALVASGGFCAPSETMYSFFGIEGANGLLDLPTVGVARGGMQVPDYIGLDAVAAGIWNWTEQDDINPGTKPCLQVPCPDWNDVRLQAEGLCITAGNLQDRAIPELTARVIDLAVTAHLHAMSASMIASIVASATGVTVATAPSDAAGDILNAIDLQVADYRSQYLMDVNATLDAVMPLWFIEAIRSTLAMRAGVESYAIPNAAIVGFFTTRNIRPQFVHDYEPLFDTAPATAWPATSSFLLYPAGGYVQGSGGVLDLGVVRDSTLNETNDFTAAWTEEFYSVMQLGPNAREVTVTTDVTGVTGGPAFPSAVPVGP